jgi:hypothetical protein
MEGRELEVWKEGGRAKIRELKEGDKQCECCEERTGVGTRVGKSKENK